MCEGGDDWGFFAKGPTRSWRKLPWGREAGRCLGYAIGRSTGRAVCLWWLVGHGKRCGMPLQQLPLFLNFGTQ